MLLLDRAEFPRDKPCGGGVTLRAAQQIPVSIDPVVEQVVTVAELGLAYRRKVERGAGGPLVLHDAAQAARQRTWPRAPWPRARSSATA